MQEVKLEKIRQKAKQYHDAGIKWHFHILTPACLLNDSGRYAFTLECATKREQFVHYSDQAKRELGRELAPLLHGSKVLEKETNRKYHKPTAKVQSMLKRMEKLNEKRIEWHHHVLYPDCIFNQHAPKYNLVFEDPETGKKIEYVTDEEPQADIELIEPLFYQISVK